VVFLIFCKSEIPGIQSMDGLGLLKRRSDEKAVGDQFIGGWPILDFLGRHDFGGSSFF
jgi:hypothetical protein